MRHSKISDQHTSQKVLRIQFSWLLINWMTTSSFYYRLQPSMKLYMKDESDKVDIQQRKGSFDSECSDVDAKMPIVGGRFQRIWHLDSCYYAGQVKSIIDAGRQFID